MTRSDQAYLLARIPVPHSPGPVTQAPVPTQMVADFKAFKAFKASQTRFLAVAARVLPACDTAACNTESHALWLVETLPAVLGSFNGLKEHMKQLLNEKLAESRRLRRQHRARTGSVMRKLRLGETGTARGSVMEKGFQRQGLPESENSSCADLMSLTCLRPIRAQAQEGWAFTSTIAPTT